MASFRAKATFDHQTVDPNAKSELVQIDEIVEITDPGTIEKFLANDWIEPVDGQIGEAIDEPRVQQGDTLEPGESGVLTNEGAAGASDVVEVDDKDKPTGDGTEKVGVDT